MRLRVGHQHSQFWPILARFVDYYSLFLGPGVISMIDEPQGVLTCWSSTLTVLVDSGRFMDYYSPFWGPEAISIVFEPPTCRPSIVTLLADSGPFVGLLVTVLGSRSDIHD